MRLAELQIKLDQKGGPSGDGELFEEILSQQDDVLKSFGLPIRRDFEELLWFKSVPTEGELKTREAQLHTAASKFLLSNAKSELQILREAKENQSDPMFILPELKIATHAYTNFIFKEVLLKGNDTPENILHILKLCNTHEILQTLGEIYFGKHKGDPAKIEFLESKGLKYLKEYMRHALI